MDCCNQTLSDAGRSSKSKTFRELIVSQSIQQAVHKSGVPNELEPRFANSFSEMGIRLDRQMERQSRPDNPSPVIHSPSWLVNFSVSLSNSSIGPRESGVLAKSTLFAFRCSTVRCKVTELSSRLLTLEITDSIPRWIPCSVRQGSRRYFEVTYTSREMSCHGIRVEGRVIACDTSVNEVGKMSSPTLLV